MTNNLILARLKQLPANPGVYLMKDTEGNILYVGKATSLRQRVRSYFSTASRLPVKVQRLVAQVSDFEYFVTGSEQEALILELNLIKRYRPHFNVLLKDDKAFPYLKIDISEKWPRVFTTRRPGEDKGRYFGPFASAKSIRQALKMIKELFPFRSCSRLITGADKRPCLDYHIHRCLGPCIGAVSQEEYAALIKQVILFLEGKQDTLVHELEGEMKKAAESLEFEKASLLRDRIQAISEVVEGQRIAAKVKGEQDVIAFVQAADQAYVQVFFIRDGKLIGRESFVLQGACYEAPSRIMTSFVKQFYNSASLIPPLILLQHPMDDAKVIREWLESKRGSKVMIQVPSRGSKKQLVAMVAENARQGLEQLRIKHLSAPASLKNALAEIQRELHLPHLPVRIEGYDISNIQGKMAAGSMVVFENGKPKPTAYRRFRIRTVAGADDYAMLQEVLRRRFLHGLKKDASETDSWAASPDLLLIDGGKGQLNAAIEAMREVGADSVPIAGLAKEREELFIPGQKEVIVLPGSSPGLQLLQRLRDEAHRFALGYFKRLHRKETFTSTLDNIPGIGPKRKRALLKQFGSLRTIREASVEELAATRGMSQSLAKKLKEAL